MYLLFALSLAAGADQLTQESYTAMRAVAEFQRAADQYAFARRQVDGRRPAAQEGALFSPMIGDVLQQRIKRAIRSGCPLPVRPATFVVPNVNHKAGDALPLDQCLLRVLPSLPAELHYRAAGAVLLLVDSADGTVVDVLHGAFQYDS